MHRMLERMPCVAVVMDDLLLWEKTKEHDHNLEQPLFRCREHNLRLNFKKCSFLQAEVPYLGHIFAAEGLNLDPQRVQGLLKMA